MRKLYEEEGVDFKQILQAQKANTCLFTVVHKLEPEEESDDDEERTGLKVNSHWFKGFDDDEEEEGSEEFFDEITDVLDAFGTTHANATSNASLGRSTSDRNATAVRNGNNAIAPRNSRATSGNNDIASPRSDIPPVAPPIQEEKLIGNKQEDAEEEEEEHCQLGSTVHPYLFGETTSGNATLEQIEPPNSNPSPDQDATPPGGSSPNQHLMPVISAKPEAATMEELWMFGPSPQQTPKQPSPAQASPSKASPSSSPKQPVTPVVSTRLVTEDGENTANTLSMQQNPKQPRPTQETQIALTVKPGSTGTNKSESSGTNESEKGVMTGQKAAKGTQRSERSQRP